MAERMGVGLVGCGNIARTYARLAPLFRTFELRGCADLSAPAAEALAAETGLPACTPEALLVRDDIDIILNLTIPAAHLEVSRAALAAGKHVYSEKPLTLTRAEGEALLAEAAERGLRVGAAPDTFLGAAHQRARAVVDAGQIGAVHSGSCFLLGPGMEGWHPNPAFFFQPGGGPVLDMGPYYVTNLVQLLGPVAEVMALGSRPRSQRQVTSAPRLGEVIEVAVDTTVLSLLSFASGAQVIFGASWDVWRHGHAPMELYGSLGALNIPDPNFFGGAVQWNDRGSDQPDLAPEGPLGVENDPNGANYRGVGLADMAAAIREGRPHRASGALAMHVVEVLTGILAAAGARQPVQIDTRPPRPAPLSVQEAAALLR